MDKRIKKLSSVVLCAAMLAVSAPVGVFAEDDILSEYKVISNLNVKKDFFGNKLGITGTVDLHNTVVATEPVLVEGSQDVYEGKISSSVEAADLFEGSYKLYEKEFKGKKDILGRAWENIVMFNEGGSFPTAQYTIKFPEGVKIDKNSIKATENTATISSIEAVYNEANNTVTITIALGNWNDYKGFFELVAKERNKSGHLINVDIPYIIDGTSLQEGKLGQITGSGICSLYKTSGFIKGNVVNITATDNFR